MKYEKLLVKRNEKKLTHQNMAELLKISKSYYCQIENCKRTLSYKMAYKISKLLETKPDELFYDTLNDKN